MHQSPEDRRKNAPNSRGRKEKCAEIEKTEEKFTDIKKTEGNMQ
jgi:hypothetical protein